MKAVVKSVDAYIAQFPEAAQQIMNRLRALILLNVPEAEEKIMYGVPFYRHRDALGGFAAYQSHVSFGFGSDSLTEEIASALSEKGYHVGKATVQIRFDQSVPEREITAIVLTKLKLNVH
jgi:uncharacterized protein YdhG (YjbR/CyaY superfamily)